MNQRLPNSLLSDDAIDPALLSENPMADFQRAEEMRVSANRAWMALDSRARMQRSLRARHRVPVASFTEGNLVFVWRQPRVGPGKYIGPGIIILPTSGGAWVNMRGALWKCSDVQVKNAASEELRGLEFSNLLLNGMREELRSGQGRRGFIDVEREGPPPPDAAAPSAAPEREEERPQEEPTSSSTRTRVESNGCRQPSTSLIASAPV